MLFWSVAVISFFSSSIRSRLCQIFNTSKNSKLVSFIRKKNLQIATFLEKKINWGSSRCTRTSWSVTRCWTGLRPGRDVFTPSPLDSTTGSQGKSSDCLQKFRLPSEWCNSPFYSHNWHRSGLDDEKRSDRKIQARLQSKQRGEVQMCRLHLWCLLQGDNVHAKQMRDYFHWCVHNLFVDMALSSLMLTGHRLDDPDIWRWDFCLQR